MFTSCNLIHWAEWEELPLICNADLEICYDNSYLAERTTIAGN